MSHAKTKIEEAYKWAFANRPKVDGFPYLAEALRLADVNRYVYELPSCQCIYYTNAGNIVGQMEPLINEMEEVPLFSQEGFIKILRIAQMGESTFSEFLKDSWKNGIISYEADLISRKVTYYGANGEKYIESYPAVEIKK